eukprot:GHVL01015368.1.p1 GENE.GHVL01015368.1~~GHVL01015368.1.p1  ORF type:complete len:612 (-),score=88.28 GHVL01015368.1:1071-2906(-)
MLRKYKKTGIKTDADDSWSFYYKIFHGITKQLNSLTELDLQYVSPQLLDAVDLQLCVPGSYRPDEELVTIHRFISSLSVVTSKQKPRVIQIWGSDGRRHQFLLKGHEDMKQDERVMQVFEFVNDLLYKDKDNRESDLTIQRYAVVPLAAKSGLVGWVSHCDTLHRLIQAYRERVRIPLSIEHSIIKRACPDFERLTLRQKVEIFRYVLQNTNGEDLAKIFWLQSPSTAVWLRRRSTYAKSLAVNSIVGYILGLGDRHPSNIMFHRLTGKVVHIDFGDCFEVAALRERYPEKVPFRLTRMLVNALEACREEGAFRQTAEMSMNLLRRNKDTLMAMLEAFVFDPLITWRLLPLDRRRVAFDGGGGSSAVDDENGVEEKVIMKREQATTIEFVGNCKEIRFSHSHPHSIEACNDPCEFPAGLIVKSAENCNLPIGGAHAGTASNWAVNMVTDELTSLSNEEEAHKHRDAPTTFLSSSLSASLSNSTLLSNKEGNSHESPKGSIDFDLRAEENTPDFTKFHSVQELSIAQPEGGKDNQKWKSSASSKVKNTESQRNTTWASDDGNPQIIAEEMQSEIHQESRNEDPHLRTEKIKATRARELQHQVSIYIYIFLNS